MPLTATASADALERHVAGPLTGVRVLAVEQFGAGPWATLQLAGLGASVIKIEDPRSGGDTGRYVVPFQAGEDSLFFEAFNGGKSSISLDLRHPDGERILHRLAEKSDVVFSNLRGDQPRRLGLHYDALAKVNPRIVCCALSGYGLTGPRSAQGAYDYVIQGYAGWMSLTGDPDGPPTKSGLSLVDFMGGFAAGIAILASLRQVELSGVGCDCDVSLFDVALSLTNYVATWALSSQWRPSRMRDSAHPSLVPFQQFRTQDGYIVICCAKEELFRRLCTALALEWMIEDPRFSTFAARRQNREECVHVLSARLRERPAAQWIAELESAGVPCGPVNDVTEAFQDPQAIARRALEEYEHSRLGLVRRPRPAIRIGEPGQALGPAPRRGEHTRQILRSLGGYSDAAIDELAKTGLFGDLEV